MWKWHMSETILMSRLGLQNYVAMMPPRHAEFAHFLFNIRRYSTRGSAISSTGRSVGGALRLVLRIVCERGVPRRDICDSSGNSFITASAVCLLWWFIWCLPLVYITIYKQHAFIRALSIEYGSILVEKSIANIDITIRMLWGAPNFRTSSMTWRQVPVSTNQAKWPYFKILIL